MNDWVSLTTGIITVIATTTIAISAVITARLTRGLVMENRLLRRLGTEPKVVAYLKADPQRQWVIDFVLANVGQGPAKTISFYLHLNTQECSDHGVELQNSSERQPLGILPPGDRFEVFFGVSHELLGEPQLSGFRVSVKYEDFDGGHHEDNYWLDVAQFKGLSYLGRQPESRIADSLEKIQESMRIITSYIQSAKLRQLKKNKRTREK